MDKPDFVAIIALLGLVILVILNSVLERLAKRAARRAMDKKRAKLGFTAQWKTSTDKPLRRS